MYSIETTLASRTLLSLTGNILTLDANSLSEITESPIPITLKAYLVDYPNVEVTEELFTIEIIDPCKSTQLKFEAELDNMKVVVNGKQQT